MPNRIQIRLRLIVGRVVVNAHIMVFHGSVQRYSRKIVHCGLQGERRAHIDSQHDC